jgi:opacity protein-like surface antigen
MARQKGTTQMKKILLVAVLVAFALPAVAAAETWTNVSLIDHMCFSKFKTHPDDHPTSCLIKCAGSGYGIIAADGTWLKFDEAGNQKALAALKATDKKDHIRADVTGTLKDGTIQVTDLTIPK